MGTNYYLIPNACPHCGRGDEKLHIGKSSAGWCFGLHVRGYEWEDEIPTDLAGWQEAWSQPNSVIKDEYGDVVTPEQMLNCITNRAGGTKYPNSFYKTHDEFCRQNQCESGPNGLARHIVGRHGFCIGHGEGTWDLLTGEFS